MRSRFPKSMRAMHQQFPERATVQIRVMTKAGTIIEIEGALEDDDVGPILDLALKTHERRPPGTIDVGPLGKKTTNGGAAS